MRVSGQVCPGGGPAGAPRAHAHYTTLARPHTPPPHTQNTPSPPPLALRWDFPFWAERLREAKFSISDEELRPYFALPSVLKGLFQVRARVGARVRMRVCVRARVCGRVCVWAHVSCMCLRVWLCEWG